MPAPFKLRLRLSKQTSIQNKCPGQSSSTADTGHVRNKSATPGWREKLKMKDAAKYTQEKLKAKSYSKVYRLEMALAEEVLKKRNISEEERAKAEMWLQRKQKYNEGCRRRMREYLKRKKSSAGKSGMK